MKKRDSNLLTRSTGSRPEGDHALKVLSESDVYRHYAPAFFRGHRPAAERPCVRYAERHPASAKTGKSLLCIDGQNERHVLQCNDLQGRLEIAAAYE
jgi:hypothetical protein